MYRHTHQQPTRGPKIKQVLFTNIDFSEVGVWDKQLYSYYIHIIQWGLIFHPCLTSMVVWYRWFSHAAHYCDVMMGSMASQITTIVYSTVHSGTDQSRHQSIASLAFVRGIHRWPVNSPHKRASNAENVSISWRHHGWTCDINERLHTTFCGRRDY